MYFAHDDIGEMLLLNHGQVYEFIREMYACQPGQLCWLEWTAPGYRPPRD